ncbi:hypothetical protein [Methylobacterium sp. D54C]
MRLGARCLDDMPIRPTTIISLDFFLKESMTATNIYTDLTPSGSVRTAEPGAAANDNFVRIVSMDEIFDLLSTKVDFGIYWVVSRTIDDHLAGITTRSVLIPGRPWPAEPVGER